MAPQLRGIVQSKLKRDIGFGIAFAISMGMCWKYFIAWPRKQRYLDYYKNFDAEKEALKLEKELAEHSS